MSNTNLNAVLVLADGTVFKGTLFGASGISVGEVVFNTSMTGYQEIITDPSYAQQIVTLTYPHIGNVGANAQDSESTKPFSKGLIIRDLPKTVSSWRAEQTLSEFMLEKGLIGISGVDTRRLTRHLRKHGSQAGCLMAGEVDTQHALQQARDFAGIDGMDLAKEVTTDVAYSWQLGSTWSLDSADYQTAAVKKFKVVAYDFGVKHNILRLLAERGCDITVVPAQTTAEEAMAYNPDGIFLSNGPGDPEPCDYAITAIQAFLDKGVPLFGICLGHQLMAIASGASTFKMKTGHHGGNHPVQELSSKRVMITSQNHGFSVSEEGLPEHVQVTHKSLFDGTVQGIKRTDKPAFSFQGHPEASPGPQDIVELFDQFIDLMITDNGAKHA